MPGEPFFPHYSGRIIKRHPSAIGQLSSAPLRQALDAVIEFLLAFQL
jgi:hypothetical protein